MRVWLESWEWQCCGEPFAVGSEVEWGLMPILPDDRSYLVDGLGSELVDGITHFETHHADLDEDPRPTPTPGRVASITAVYWARAPRSSEENVYYPVPGTAVLEARDRAGGSEPETDDGPQFEGYIVELAPLG